MSQVFGNCPHCGEGFGIQVRPGTSPAEMVKPSRRTTRLGGRQVPLGPAVRAVAAYLTDKGFMDEQKAERTARRVMLKALPAKQRRPRAQSQLRDAA